jgi:hypothetical protein
MVLVEKFSRSKFVENISMFFLFSLPSLLLYRPIFENDTYWLLNTGKYVLYHGIPHTEPFTIHSGLNLIVQQWLTTVVFYAIYQKYGALGLHIFSIIGYSVITFLIYRLAFHMAKGKKLVASYVAAFVGIYLSYYMVLRPQIFSLLIFVIEMFLLEYYIRDQRQRPIRVAVLPFLSVLLINLHSAMWPFFLLLYAPYLIDSFKFRFGKLEGQGYGKLPLFVAFLLSAAAGFANPYGVHGMFYLINSYGNALINNSIREMLSPDFKGLFGIAVFAIVLTVALIYITVRGTTRLRYVLLTIGTLYMGLCSVRSFSLFVVFGITFLAHYLKDIDLSNTMPAKRRAVLISLAVLVMLLFRVSRNQNLNAYEESYKPEAAVQYIKDNLDLSKVRLYNGYNTGGYIEFSGLRAFIDSRAEVFTKRLNGREDILEDDAKAETGEFYYSEFIAKYSFTHLLLYKGGVLDNSLKHDPKYTALFQDKKYILYGRK